jgi:methylated-DNA-[protein]-cysteine S-methyltransferase
MTQPQRSLFMGGLPDTPLGNLQLVVSEAGLVAVEWDERLADLERYLSRLARPVHLDPGPLKPYVKELREYLQCQRREFTIPIDWGLLRPFQREALKLVFEIPYGETSTYGAIAAALGRPKAGRAVGRANATNPMPLVIPCHRVVGSDGKLHGYGGGKGLPTKEWLLNMEGAVLA